MSTLTGLTHVGLVVQICRPASALSFIYFLKKEKFYLFHVALHRTDKLKIASHTPNTPIHHVTECHFVTDSLTKYCIDTSEIQNQ
jgi:hypothetical protein